MSERSAGFPQAKKEIGIHFDPAFGRYLVMQGPIIIKGFDKLLDAVRAYPDAVVGDDLDYVE
jgi:hypothetical protein